MESRTSAVMDSRALDKLIQLLLQRGYEVVGPVVRDGAIVYDEIQGLKDLPAGWTDEQDGGKYRLARRADAALFGYVVGPHSWKRFLHPPTQRLWSAKRDGTSFQVSAERQSETKYAFIGVRACELAAIAIQDKVFLEGAHVDPIYRSRRENTFIVAVNCGQAGGTCFCVSMNTGPKATFGYDIALTEVLQEGRHVFVVKAGTERGAEVLNAIPHVSATPQDLKVAKEIVR